MSEQPDALIALFAGVLQVDPAELNDDSSPETVKRWDSLAAMALVTAIEERFEVQLSTKQIMRMNTIGRARKALQAMKVGV
jgi:acyl carrier protein